MTVNDMAAGDSTEYKVAWEKLIESGMVANVSYILEDCFAALSDMDTYDDIIIKAARKLGLHKKEARWQFVMRVIHYLKVTGSFGSLEHGFDDFEDTAGGCDEITENAMIYLLTHPEWAAQ
jgi:hypothetical protein